MALLQEKYRVLGIDISKYSENDFFQYVDKHLQDNDPLIAPLFVVTVNPEIVVESIIDSEFKNILSSSSINTADGIGIKWAINFLYHKKIERITGSDSLEKICSIAANNSESVFFYGAMPTIAEKAAGVLKKRIEKLNVIGTYSPEKASLPFEELPLKTQQQLTNTSVIFVALGAPAQEKWIHANLPKLPKCKVIMGIGGSFDFIAGNIKRAPKWMQKSGLEWLYRLYLQPVRWRRMLKLPLFALNVIALKSYINK